jgi:hypothetical protein
METETEYEKLPSEYDMIRNELEHSALPYQTQDSRKTRNIELENMGITII